MVHIQDIGKGKRMKSQSTFNDEALKLGEEIAELVIRKQRDYGKGNITNNILSPEDVLLSRLSEKLNRIKNLVDSGVEPENESIVDSAKDVVGLGIVLCMYLNGTFELPLKDISKS